uniref:Uncharacterized protein n=1 Tax=Clytia hemisphaerica TaxID=252671 RepID=A0A7M5URZ2_9CNID
MPLPAVATHLHPSNQHFYQQLTPQNGNQQHQRQGKPESADLLNMTTKGETKRLVAEKTHQITSKPTNELLTPAKPPPQAAGVTPLPVIHYHQATSISGTC